MEQERRTSGGQRVPFEALVVVASPKGGSGAYECEAVNLSASGMHLRTAYLPDNGQTLSFRFETGQGEVTLEGQVVWREEQARGGEFGVRFAAGDEATIATIRQALGLDEVSGEDDGASGVAAPVPHRAGRGSRVRLHIDGLNSPMRARVRDDHTGEVLVGSNLDFLKVGKPLELEDVDHGQRRGAVVDKVEVEVDPASKVPQLVVTLRYEDAGAPAAEARSAAGVRGDDAKADRATVHSASADAPADGEAQADGEAAVQPGAFGKLRDVFNQAGTKLPALSASARGAVGSLIERVRARREQEQQQQEEPTAPRRVTAPAPDGGISSMTSARRSGQSVKEDSVDHGNGEGEGEDIGGLEETDEESLKIRKKQRVMIAAGAGLLALLLVVFGVRARSSTPPGDATAAIDAPAATLAVNAAPQHGLPAAIGSGDSVTANVPLFGTTPLTTTEAAALPAPAVSAPGALAQNAPGSGSGNEDDAEPATPGKTEFGQGTVKKPHTVRIKMDAPITDVRGSTSDDTITLFLPGRRNVEPATPLLKRDKRLSAAKIVPKDGGVELSLAFKDDAPPFLAKANGKVLEIDLGETAKGGSSDDDGDDTVASKKSHGKKKVAKGGAKAAGSKKATAKKADKKGKKKAHKHDD